jgi:LuxR family transcriptional regulator, maltose regulon positive regulatory protein
MWKWPGEEPPRPLTSEELAVLRYLPERMSFENIGERLSMPQAVVRTLAISIYGKLEVVTRLEAVYKARLLGLISSAED